jgi:uncharacterized damage-inducible protein DinB
MANADLGRVPEFYHGYINHVKENDLVSAFRNQSEPLMRFFNELPVSKREHRYAEGKWTIKQLLQHLIDAERIFAYRALRFARKDDTPLSGFDEDSYANNAKTDQRDWDDLMEEFRTVRKSSEIMFGSFDEDQLESSGTSNGKSVYVRAIGFIIVGHASHHVRVIKERYL